jgi:glucose/arabinose dehydrogenase
MKKSVFASTLSALAWAGIALAWQQDSSKLPPPNQSANAPNGPKIIAKPDGAHLRVPPGFHVEEFAAGFEKPRIMIAAPNGEILVTDSVPKGSVTVLVDKNGDGKEYSELKNLIEGLDRPY